jgi:nucleoside-diphosphate-sugar epimerase
MSTTHRIFLAGASGAIGRRLIPLLREAGHHVVGITRAESKLGQLRALGIEARAVDVFDAGALARAAAEAAPDIVMHQLTDLAGVADPATYKDAIARNARIRDEGTRNLIDAAIAAGARRMVAQSIAWVYAPGPTPHAEEDPLDRDAPEPLATSIKGVIALEDQVLGAPALEGVVLRFGQLYGPGTGRDVKQGSAPIHVDAAAYASLLAIDRAAPGVFNLAEPNGEIATDKARRELGWNADLRLPGHLLTR